MHVQDWIKCCIHIVYDTKYLERFTNHQQIYYEDEGASTVTLHVDCGLEHSCHVPSWVRGLWRLMSPIKNHCHVIKNRICSLNVISSEIIDLSSNLRSESFFDFFFSIFLAIF